MATTVLQRSFRNSRIFDKSLIIEMNEAPGEVTKDPAKKKTEGLAYTETQAKSPHQGSIISLESRSAEDQPLTAEHACRYDECHKFRQGKMFLDPTMESPGSPLKNFFLVLALILLTLWIITYTVLARLKLF